MGNMNVDRDSFWSALYVLLSRATRMEDLLLFRCPPKEFFDTGPPQYLKAFLKHLHEENGTIEAGSELIENINGRPEHRTRRPT